MSIATDFKITAAEISTVHVEAQPTVLRGTATQNKQVFDKYSDMIADHFNDLCDFLYAQQSTGIDDSVLTFFASLGWVAD